MSIESEDLLAKASEAAERHIVVIGGGVSGLVAAREFAKVGMRVTVLEAETELGGAVRRAELDGVVIDAGAESFATRGGHVRALAEELGLGDRIVAPRAGGAWLAGLPGGTAAPLPRGGVLGIPAVAFAKDVVRIIGWRGAWRAYTDRMRPLLTIGQERSLGRLVRTRMGALVHDRLVAPVTAGVYSANPDDIDVDIAAPGLNAEMSASGSLSGGVANLLGRRAERAADKAPGSAVEGLVGGMSTLVDALRSDAERLGARILTDHTVTRIAQVGEEWTVTVADAAREADATVEAAITDAVATTGAEPASDADVQDHGIRADGVVVATTADTAHDLLSAHVAGLAAPAQSPRIEIVTLLLDAASIEGAPRGTGVLTVPGSFTAKALTHASAKWSWIGEAAGGRHVVRVSFGSQGEPAATAALDDEAAAALALREASALLGVGLLPTQVVASHRARFTQSQPASLLGAAERREHDRAAIAQVPGLAAVGAWLSGTGLAQVVPDAVTEAGRLRAQLLWDD